MISEEHKAKINNSVCVWVDDALESSNVYRNIGTYEFEKIEAQIKEGKKKGIGYIQFLKKTDGHGYEEHYIFIPHVYKMVRSTDSLGGKTLDLYIR